MNTLNSLFQNSTFAILTNILNRVGNAIIFILIVQWLGVERGGIYTLAIAFFFIGSRFAFLGLDHLLTREVAKTRSQIQTYLSNFLFMRLVVATVIILAFLAFIQLPDYTSETKLVIAIILLSILPESVNNLCWATYAAFEEFHFTSISVFIGSFVQIILGFFLLTQGYGLIAMAAVFLLNNLAAMIINLMILRIRYIPHWKRPDFTFIKQQLPIALPFIIISIFFILNSRMDAILLSLLANETALGVYGAATAVIVTISMISQGYRIAVLPIMSRYHAENSPSLRTLYEKSYKYLLILSFPITVATFMLADELIQLIYRQPLPQAIPVLKIMSISLVFMFLNVLNNRLLIVFNKQSRIAHFLIASTTLNLILNLILAGSFGATGAGLARVGSVFLLFVLNTFTVRLFIPSFTGWYFVSRPLLSAILMGLTIWLLTPTGFWGQVLFGSIVYILSLFILGTFSPSEKKTFYQLVRQKLAAIWQILTPLLQNQS